MSEFKSLSAALEGYYEVTLGDLPDDLQKRVERAFFFSWDSLTPEDRRNWALSWDRENEPSQQEAQQAAFNLTDEIGKLKDSIDEVTALPATVPSEATAKRLETAELQQQLANREKELARIGAPNTGLGLADKARGPGNRPYGDDDLAAEAAQAFCSGRSKSFREAASALVDKIPGAGTPESKIKRIAAKAARIVAKAAKERSVS